MTHPILCYLGLHQIKTSSFNPYFKLTQPHRSNMHRRSMPYSFYSLTDLLVLINNMVAIFHFLYPHHFLPVDRFGYKPNKRYPEHRRQGY